jgi:hypothetical protein
MRLDLEFKNDLISLKERRSEFQRVNARNRDLKESVGKTPKDRLSKLGSAHFEVHLHFGCREFVIAEAVCPAMPIVHQPRAQRAQQCALAAIVLPDDEVDTAVELDVAGVAE